MKFKKMISIVIILNELLTSCGSTKIILDERMAQKISCSVEDTRREQQETLV